MANKYCNGGNYNGAGVWYDAPTGGSTTSTPTLSDDIFPRTSPASTTLTVNVASACASLDWTSGSGWTIAGTGALSVYGSYDQSTGVTSHSHTGAITFRGTESHNLKSGGIPFSCALTFSLGGGSYSLQDALTTSDIITISGEGFITNGFSVTCTGTTAFNASAATKVLNITNSLITCNGGASFNTAGLFTFTSTGSHITIATATRTFAGGGNTFGILEQQQTALTITGNNTFYDIVGAGAAKTIVFTAASTQILTSSTPLATNGAPGLFIIFVSSTTGQSYFINLPNVTSTIYTYWYSFRDCHITLGIGGVFNTAASGGNIDNGNNTGINFLYNRYCLGGNYNDTASWSLTSSGTVFSPIPDNNGSNGGMVRPSLTPNSLTLTVNANSACMNFDFSSSSGWTLAGGSNLTVYGYYNQTGIISRTHNGITNLYGSMVFNVTSNGLPFLGNIVIGLGNGTCNLLDNLSCSTLSIVGSSIVSNGHMITCAVFSAGAATKTIDISNSIVNCSGAVTFNTAANFTLVGAGSRIIMTGTTFTFTGGGNANFGILESRVTTLTIVGNNTFYDIVPTQNKTIKFTAGSTTTFTSPTTLQKQGISGQLITFVSTTNGSFYSFKKTSGNVIANYYSIRDCHADGGATFYAINSTLVSGDTGWLTTLNVITNPTTGAISIQGNTANVVVDRVIVVDPTTGAISIQGNTANVVVDRVIVVDPTTGAISIQGNTANVVVDRVIVVDPTTGAISIQGNTANVVVDRVIVVDPTTGAISIQGNTANVVVDRVIVVDPTTGAISIQGNTANVVVDRVIVVDPTTGAISIQGNTANVVVDRVIVVDPTTGAISIQGNTANVVVETGQEIEIHPVTGIVEIRGNNSTVIIERSIDVNPTTGIMLIQGNTATIIIGNILKARYRFKRNNTDTNYIYEKIKSFKRELNSATNYNYDKIKSFKYSKVKDFKAGE